VLRAYGKQQEQPKSTLRAPESEALPNLEDHHLHFALKSWKVEGEVYGCFPEGNSWADCGQKMSCESTAGLVHMHAQLALNAPCKSDMPIFTICNWLRNLLMQVGCAIPF
jgi:hypothetical protein